MVLTFRSGRARRAACALLLLAGACSAALAADWPMFGVDARNLASQGAEVRLSPKTVGTLSPKWTFTTAGDVSARAAVTGGVVYFPDWAGNLYAVKAANGAPVWTKKIADYTGIANSNSRTTPAVAKGVVYVGTQEGAFLLAIKASTGELLWRTALEPGDPFAIISASPTVENGVIYTGVASTEEGAVAFIAGYPCCNGRGSVVAIDAATGQIKWKTRTVPEGYSGGGVWGSNLALDTVSNTLYAGTGNNYAHPKDWAESSQAGVTYGDCIAGGGKPASCNSPNNLVDAVVALDARTGQIKWARSLTTWNDPWFPNVVNGSDDWNVACIIPFINPTGCPAANVGPDYDFGSAPNLITYKGAGGMKTIVGAGQKSGIYYALDPATGAVLWQTQVGPGSTLGGMEWGSASDGKRIYVQVANLNGVQWGGGGAGLWAALDPATGKIQWVTADPNGAIALGPLAVANGVVFAPSMGGEPGMPTFLALNAETGQVLWSYASGASVVAGATIADGVVYWGSGYAHLGIPGYTANTKFRAFSLGGQ